MYHRRAQHIPRNGNDRRAQHIPRNGNDSTVTPATSTIRPVARVNASEEDIASVGRVNIKHFMPELDGMWTVKYQELHEPVAEDPTVNADLLWSILLPI